MTIRKIKKKEFEKAGNIYCPFCKPEKVKAVWRKVGWYAMDRDVACDKHKNRIDFTAPKDFSEADYQTWMRLR